MSTSLRWLFTSIFFIASVFSLVRIFIFYAGIQEITFTLLEADREMQICYQQKCSAVYRSTLQFAEIPQEIPQYILYQEDQSFYEHSGISWREIFASIWGRLVAGQRLRGASTITQQLARSLFLGQERTLKRKLAEWQLAFALERQFAKKKILEMYMNTSYWGHAQIGLSSAMKFYFGHINNGRRISHLQASFLVSLLPRPENCLSWENCEDDRIKMRMRRILKKFVKKDIEKLNQ